MSLNEPESETSDGENLSSMLAFFALSQKDFGIGSIQKLGEHLSASNMERDASKRVG